MAYYKARKNYSFFWNKIRKINQEEELLRTRRWKRLLSYFLQEVRTKSDLPASRIAGYRIAEDQSGGIETVLLGLLLGQYS